MTSFTFGMQILAVIGLFAICLTVILTARAMPKLPSRLRYDKNYGDGGEQEFPKAVIWLLPFIQIVYVSIVALTAHLPNHGNPVVALIVIDCVLSVMLLIQRTVMLRPRNA